MSDSLKRFDIPSSHIDWSLPAIDTDKYLPEYIKKDAFLTLKFMRKIRSIRKPKLTKKQRRKVGREIRKRLRIERELRAFFVELNGVQPTSWQIDVMVAAIATGYEPLRLSYYYSGRGYGRTIVSKTIDAYMAKHQKRRDARLSSRPVYRNYLEQGELYHLFAERVMQQKTDDAMDAMTQSYMEFSENWHYITKKDTDDA